MKIKHNKKRNVGIVFEQLNSVMTKSIINDDMAKAKLCLSIIKEFFGKDKQLSKELKLFRSLANVYIKNDVLIARVLKEAKKLSSTINTDKLSKEKTDLIKKINESFGRDEFFKTPVENFKSFATVQILLNEWRRPSESEYALKLEDRLITEIKTPVSKSSVQRQENLKLNSLVVDLAKKKFFEKHKSLSKNQNEMLFEYISSPEDKKNILCKNYENLRTEAIEKIDLYISNKNNSEFFNEKLIESKNKLSNFSFIKSDISDVDTIARAMTIRKLLDELENA